MARDDVKTGYKLIGTRPTRPDGLDKVTGRARYGADFSLPGMLHAAVVRSPHAHARIVKIDASKALALEGVKAVVTRADLPTGLTGEDLNLQDNTLAGERALYDGHAVAAVAATSALVVVVGIGSILGPLLIGAAMSAIGPRGFFATMVAASQFDGATGGLVSDCETDF